MKIVSVNLLNSGICENYINRNINRVFWKDGSITESKGLYLGIVNFHVSICEENSLWSEEIEYVKEIEFK